MPFLASCEYLLLLIFDFINILASVNISFFLFVNYSLKNHCLYLPLLSTASHHPRHIDHNGAPPSSQTTGLLNNSFKICFRHYQQITRCFKSGIIC
ncbi:hypothetical protein EGR_10961 [Echinococcus granulosus]|uniref:Uncharacterized protein n=1 Tax=Echinococcus granulosus TaxID=6210 RepID=W6UL01_ECHGR|nr:hypothetical protein EGR_10961 [Echinococcus granulosus]EUB54179.1 hypothetical protein EGR_10961 [Echinococcus granulosus]